MEQSTNKPNLEMISKWYKFYFFDDYFECYWKAGFIKKNRKIYYRDIADISYSVYTINFVPCHTYKIIINGQKNLELGANFRGQLENLVPAIEHIKECRANTILKSINT